MHNALVLGSGRSGTSMVAGSLKRAGYFMGDHLYPARDSNPLGFFEDPEVNGLNEELLAAHVPADQRLGPMQRWLATLDQCVDPSLSPTLEQRVRALTSRAPFCFKDPRFAYTLPAWRPELAGTRFVCVFRDPAVTAASIVKECASADYLRGVPMDAARALEIWCASYRQIVERHRHQGEWLFLHYDQVVEGREGREGPEGLERLAAFLGAPVDGSFPTARLRRSRAQQPASAEARRLYAELCDLASFVEADGPRRRTQAVAPPAAPPAAPRTAPDLSVLICTYQRKKTLLECLESFSRQTLAPDRYEIVVVVDGSTDGSAQAVRDFASRAPIRLIEREKNGGLSSARSAAVAAARGDLVLFVNDDTIAFPDLLERHVTMHERRAPRPVAVLGTFEQPREQLSTALMRMLERSDLVFDYVGMRADVDYDWLKFWGCNVSVSRREVIEAGAFDAAFRHYGCEDTDLGVRLSERGIPVVYEPTARAWHRHVLAYADLERRQRTVARAQIRLLAKHPRLLDHPSWRSLGEGTLAQLDAAIAKRTRERAAIEGPARQLAVLDCDALEAQSGSQAAIAAAAVDQLSRLVAALNRGWWSEGFADGLRALGVKSFRELCALRDPAAAPWPLSTEHPVRVLAWPRWDDDEELAALLSIAADARLGGVAPCLCLRHDPGVDGAIESAAQRLERVSERVLRGGDDVTALMVGEPMRESDWPRLGNAVTCALLLASSDEGERARFFVRAGAPGVRGVEDLLAFVPASPLPRAQSRVWSEISV